MKTSALLRQVLLLALAIIFSIALMFAFTELPRLLDSVLFEHAGFPGLDHGRDDLSGFMTEIYISALHLRWIGYACLGLVVLFIILGFITRRSGWALAGAFTLFLPVFGQFALSMFFLAGLGMLRVGWLPFWDASFQVLDLGNVIYIPYWILMWIFRQFDYWAQPGLAWFFMATGAFIFSWGVLVWMQSKFSKEGVATSWIYRISRHPQYLGWIIWTYGLILYAPLVNQMKKSWGLGSSLPWLLMTMIIIGICMLEELRMKEKYGMKYDQYLKRTPFLFPLPGWFKRIIRYPIWLLIRKKWPEKKSEVALVLGVYTMILIALSLFWVDMGSKRIFPLSEERREAKVAALVEEIEGSVVRRERWWKFEELSGYGQAAVAPMIAFLKSDNPENQELAAEYVGRLKDTSAIRPLIDLLDHSWENVRVSALQSLAALDYKGLEDVLIMQISKEEAMYPRTVIYSMLGETASEESWDILVDAASRATEWENMAAVKAMVKIYPDSVAPYLIPFFDHKNTGIRIDAVAVANQIEDPRTLPFLGQLLDDEHYEVRFFARQAMESIRDK